MTLRVQSSPPSYPVSLPPRARIAVVLDPITMQVQTERIVAHDRDLTMRRQLRPSSAMIMPRRPSPARRELARAQALPMPSPMHAVVDELSDLLALDDRSSRLRPDEFARPSWCTHEGVTVTRVGHRACLRCGAVLGGV